MESGEIRDYTERFGDDQANGDRNVQEARRKELLATTKITGWFALLLFAEISGGILSICMTMATTCGNGGDIDSLLAHPLLGGTDILTGVIMLVLGFVAPAKAWRRSADAVFYLRLYMVYCLTLNLIGLFTGVESSVADRFSPGMTAKGIVWPIIWLAYSWKSLQVSDVFPKDYRRVPRFAIVVAVLIFVIPAATFGIGVLRARLMAANWNRPEIQKTVLSEGEYTDGHIVFSAPEGVEVSHDDSMGLYFPLSVEKEGVFGGIVAADMFTTKDEATFNAIREDVRESSLSFAKESSVKTSFKSLPEGQYGMRACIRTKSVRLVDDGIDVRWRFAVIYAPQYAKVVILSFYDKGDGKYFNELVASVRFSPSGRVNR